MPARPREATPTGTSAGAQSRIVTPRPSIIAAIPLTCYLNLLTAPYLAAVVRGDVRVEPTDLSALANNVTVARILDAARESARTRRTVPLAAGGGAPP